MQKKRAGKIKIKIVIKAINFFDEENYFMTFCASTEFPHKIMRSILQTEWVVSGRRGEKKN